MPQSGIVVEPTMTTPASSSLSVVGAFAAAIGGFGSAVPDGFGRPARATFSFTVPGTPSKGLSCSPAAQRAVDSAASARTSSGSCR